MHPTDYLLLIPLGLAAGAAGGLLGIGGSLVMIPALVILFGPQDQHLYQAAAMIGNLFIVAASVRQHLRVRATLRPVTRWMVPSALAAAVAGVWLSERGVFRGAGQGYLQIIFGVFLLYELAYNLWRLKTRTRLPQLSEADAAQLSRVRIVALVGLPTGLLGGLLGIGGGLVAVPTQQVFLRIPLPNAIANSAATILWSALAGAVYKNAALGSHGYSLAQSFLIAACLIPTAMVSASYFAARVHRWRVGVIRAAFVVLLAYAAFELLRVGWGQVSRAAVPTRSEASAVAATWGVATGESSCHRRGFTADATVAPQHCKVSDAEAGDDCIADDGLKQRGSIEGAEAAALGLPADPLAKDDQNRRERNQEAQDGDGCRPRPLPAHEPAGQEYFHEWQNPGDGPILRYWEPIESIELGDCAVRPSQEFEQPRQQEHCRQYALNQKQEIK